MPFLCLSDVNYRVACIGKVQCPVHLKSTVLGLTAAKACHALCEAHEACGSFIHNAYGHCYLRPAIDDDPKVQSKLIVPDDFVHRTVLCRRVDDEDGGNDLRNWQLLPTHQLDVDTLYTLQMLAAGAAPSDAVWSNSSLRHCDALLTGTDITSAAEVAPIARGSGRTPAVATAQVINLGMIKTGTTSLHSALQWSLRPLRSGRAAACKWRSDVRLHSLFAFVRELEGKPSPHGHRLQHDLETCTTLSDNPWWVLFPTLLRRYGGGVTPPPGGGGGATAGGGGGGAAAAAAAGAAGAAAGHTRFILTTHGNCTAWTESAAGLFGKTQLGSNLRLGHTLKPHALPH